MGFQEFTYIFTTIILPVLCVGYMFFLKLEHKAIETINDYGGLLVLGLLGFLVCAPQVPEKIVEAYQIPVQVINLAVSLTSIAIIGIIVLQAKLNSYQHSNF